MSQGWRCGYAYMDVGKGREQERKLCPWMNGMSQGARDGGVTHAHGWAVFRNETWMADSRTIQDAYMDVSGRTTQETKSSYCRGTEAAHGWTDRYP